jgi:hypothetical protein
MLEGVYCPLFTVEKEKEVNGTILRTALPHQAVLEIRREDA